MSTRQQEFQSLFALLDEQKTIRQYAFLFPIEKFFDLLEHTLESMFSHTANIGQVYVLINARERVCITSFKTQLKDVIQKVSENHYCSNHVEWHLMVADESKNEENVSVKILIGENDFFLVEQ